MGTSFLYWGEGRIMKNKYLDATKFHFLDSRGAVIEGMLELYPKRFTKKELHEALYRKLSVSSVTGLVSPCVTEVLLKVLLLKPQLLIGPPGVAPSRFKSSPS